MSIEEKKITPENYGANAGNYKMGTNSLNRMPSLYKFSSIARNTTTLNDIGLSLSNTSKHDDENKKIMSELVSKIVDSKESVSIEDVLSSKEMLEKVKEYHMKVQTTYHEGNNEGQMKPLYYEGML